MGWLASQIVTLVNDAREFWLEINQKIFKYLNWLIKIVLRGIFKHNIEMVLNYGYDFGGL